MHLKCFQNQNLQGKTIVMRVDYNVPMKGNNISDNTRIKESLPTIKALLKAKAKIILMSHLGRPDGKINLDLSLAPIAKALSRMLFKSVTFLKDCQGEEVEKVCANLKPGSIVLLENLRFHPEEEANDNKFAESLSKLGSVYINDAFGTAHRAHASTVGITKFLPSYAGYLIQKEVENLSLLLENQEHPFTLIIGGAKIDTKIDIINNFLDTADNFIFGGGIANTFLAAQDYHIGSSLVENDKIPVAKSLREKIHSNHKKLYIPLDSTVSTEISADAFTENVNSSNVVGQFKILDIGKESAEKFAEVIEQSKVIVWNGPVGVYEYKPFRAGTKSIAQAIIKATKHGATSILGGGDTLDALKILKLSHKKFTHVSTGGGAMLEFFQKGTLPGIEVLKA